MKDQNKTQVLLVEDMKIAQKIAEITLMQLNCEVDTAERGSEALERIHKKKYHIIFMDLGLPDIDGLTLTETIRRMEGDVASTPIVALTANTDDELRRASLEIGLDDFLAKPLMPENAKETLIKFALFQE